jgi:hypothetical protein
MPLRIFGQGLTDRRVSGHPALFGDRFHEIEQREGNENPDTLAWGRVFIPAWPSALAPEVDHRLRMTESRPVWQASLNMA